jgi:chitodextrinase
MRKKISVALVIGLAVFSVVVRAAHAQDTQPPTVPTGISAYLTQAGQVYVSWSPSTDNVGVVGYYLYRDGQLVANTPGLLFFTDDAPAGTHSYTVSAYDAAGNVSAQSTPSSLVTVVADTEPPTVPANFTLTPSSSSIALSWGASTDNVAVIGYYVYRNGQKIILANQITGTSYTDTGLTPGVTYTYQVGAYDAAGNIGRTNSVSVTTIFDVTPPSPPYNLHATATSTGEIDLSWSPASDNIAVVGYQVYRNSTYVGASAGTSTTYRDTGLSPSTLYSYWVIAVDEVGNLSEESVPTSATTFQPDTTPPSIPSGLSFVSPSTNEIDLSWKPSTDNVAVAGYYIYRNGSQIGTTASSSYQDLGLATNTTYLYALKAYDAAGNISPQQSIAATTLVNNPVVPVTVPPANPVTTTPPPYTPPVVTSPSPTTPTPTPSPSPISGYTFTTLLSFGLRGTAVQNLQAVLIQQGDLGSAYATGYFGSLTQKALQKFQCAQGIVCSGGPSTTGWGSVGPRTRKALNALATE